MFRLDSRSIFRTARFLRASGGVSFLPDFWSGYDRFSPRKRRCFDLTVVAFSARHVFSAQAEVFPDEKCELRQSQRFLRASGGVSPAFFNESTSDGFSPRKRRCFLALVHLSACRLVFSAQAEVFLQSPNIKIQHHSFLRASGGVSKNRVYFVRNHKFSPRKRRCFRY